MPTVAEILRLAKASDVELPRALLFFKEWPDVDEFDDFRTGANSAAALRHMELLEARVEWLTKRPGGVFPDQIGVGRTRNNDVVLPITGVSKYHAYFKYDEEAECFRIADAGSKNGTELRGEPLPVREPVALESGDALSFGGLCCKFFHTDKFIEGVKSRLRK